MSLRIEYSPTARLSPSILAAVIELCDAAFGEATAAYFGTIGPGEHLLGWVGPALVSHLMWVPRWLQPQGLPVLRTAYVEMVATASGGRNRGYATTLLKAVPSYLSDFEIAALAPATENLYLRLGWTYWRGPLSTRRDGSLIPDPQERVMVLSLPRTPPHVDLDLPLSIEWRPGEVW